MGTSRNITTSAIGLAVSFIFLYLAAIVPSGTLACLCISTAGMCIIVSETGKKFGLLSGIVLDVLSWFFIPDKTISLLFILFFSYYPVVKAVAEQKSRTSEWIIKIVTFYIVSTLIYIIFSLSGLIPEALKEFQNNPVIVFIITGVVIAGCIFDYALSILMTFYMTKIIPKINKSRF